jgi:transcriptional regulator
MPSYSLISPLSQKQRTVWSMLNKGLSISAIASKLDTTRQFVNQTKLAAEAKLTKTLLEVAQANDLQVRNVYAKNGLLLGYHVGLGRNVIVSYSSNHGIKVWYWQDKPEQVTNKEFLKQTQSYLLDIANERGISVKDVEKTHPAKLAHAIFSELIPELKQ